MRKTALSIALSLTCVGLAGAWSPNNDAPEAHAYASFGFGESRQQTGQFFYGMRLDQGYASRIAGRPAVAQVQFNRYGFSEASVNGVPFARTVRLAQTEGGEGGGSEGGTFSNFTFVDWTLLAVGVAAVGYGISEVINQKDSPDPATGGTTTGGTTTGTPLGGLLGGTTTGGTTTGTPLGGLLGGLLGGYASEAQMLGDTRSTAEYQEWLDGGTGQMGDLSPR
ncbi:MAG: hypothetical protein Q7J29_01490 [Stagnimonas sp.]|nr:hypothetical protein [Stagnimonas sp.]